MKTHKEIAEEVLGYAIDEEGFAPCPGAAYHSTQSGTRDWKIWFDGEGKPHEHCFHSSCQAVRDEFMRNLYRAIGAQERGGRYRRQDGNVKKGPAPLAKAPNARKIEIDELDEELAIELAGRIEEDIDFEWLKAHSPIPIPKDYGEWPKVMLDALYSPGDRILVFTDYRSQGNFLYQVGDKVYRLGRKPGMKSIPAHRFPLAGDSGVWFLTAPVTGKWQPNKNKKDKRGNIMPGRRHGDCCLRFPYLVLESDNLDPLIWLKIVVQLHDPIVAIYTSGGKSVHCLVRVDAGTPEEFNIFRYEFITRLVALGADPGAITPVRLSRLPGCRRYKAGDGTEYDQPRMQELLFLNPQAQQGEPIINLPLNH